MRKGAGLHLQDPALAPGELPWEVARFPDGLVGRWGWRKASSLLSAGEELIILFSHYTEIKSILEQHKFRCLKSLFLTSRETFLSLSCPFPNHFCLIAQPSTFWMKHKMEGHELKYSEGAAWGTDPSLGGGREGEARAGTPELPLNPHKPPVLGWGITGKAKPGQSSSWERYP